MPKPFRSGDFRVLRTQPVLFSPIDPRVLYFAANTLWQTSDRGRSWKQISPDLTRKTFEVPETVGKYRTQPTAQPTQRGVIYAVAPSPLDINRIWAGTDDGLIHLTTSGGTTWKDVTPAQLKPWQKVSIIDAGHFDKNVAYAAVNTIRLDDLRPHVYRTRDSGATWTEITNGIPANENVNVVREDPQRRGLLFAGTERSVYVSFDDGDHWQSLRLNMAASSVRDLIIKDDDLAVGTHGRGFWILDDITLLRQIDDKVIAAEAHLFRPQTAIRVRWNMNTDTPLPPDEPVSDNPPDGAIINYYLNTTSTEPVTLEIQDANGQLVRRYSSADPTPTPDPQLAIPRYWLRPPQSLSVEKGAHRLRWDMRYSPVPGVKPSYGIAAIYRNTPPEPTGPWVMPGTYTVVLKANGKVYRQPITVKMDPRVKTATADLAAQFRLSKQLYDSLVVLAPLAEKSSSVRTQLVDLRSRAATDELKKEIDALDQKLQAWVGTASPPNVTAPPNVTTVLGRLRTLFNIIQGVDLAPTTQVEGATPEVLHDAEAFVSQWRAIESQEISALNQKLRAAGLPMVAP
jgi:hypothetical protein